MNTLNKPLPTLAAAAFTLLASHTAMAQDSQIKPIFSLDLSKPVVQLKAEGTRFDSKLTPSFRIGLGRDFQLNENWQLTTEVFASYASSSIEATFLNNELDSQRASGQFKQAGLWTSAKFKHIGLFEDVSPFVKVSAGVVDADIQLANQHFDEQVTGYEVSTGLEFELSDNVTMSFGVGYSDFDDIHPSANPFQ